MRATVQAERDPDETSDLHTLIAEVVQDPEVWMDTPNDVLGGVKPNDLVGTNHESRLRELARALKIGMAS
ncbi:MAG: hypothetical protein NVSMB9_19490 [Isosphaeraceae bacterium]